MTAPAFKRLNAEDFKDGERAAALLTPYLRDTTTALTDVSWESMGAVVTTLDVTMPARWTDATLTNSWAAESGYEAPGYWKDENGRVWLRGACDSGTYGSSAIFTLPEAYWPALPLSVPAVQTNATFEPTGRVNISAAGVVTAPAITSIQTGASTFLSLDGISFEASDTTPPALGAPFPLYVNCSNLAGSPESVLVVGCEDWTGNAATTAAYPRIAWAVTSQRGTQYLRIDRLDGLLPERRYRVRVVVLGF